MKTALMCPENPENVAAYQRVASTLARPLQVVSTLAAALKNRK